MRPSYTLVAPRCAQPVSSPLRGPGTPLRGFLYGGYMCKLADTVNKYLNALEQGPRRREAELLQELQQLTRDKAGDRKGCQGPPAPASS